VNLKFELNINNMAINDIDKLMEEFCRNLLAIERETEKMRNKLAESPDFEPFSVYRCIDVHKEGWITPEMLQKYFTKDVPIED